MDPYAFDPWPIPMYTDALSRARLEARHRFSLEGIRLFQDIDQDYRIARDSGALKPDPFSDRFQRDFIKKWKQPPLKSINQQKDELLGDYRVHEEAMFACTNELKALILVLNANSGDGLRKQKTEQFFSYINCAVSLKQLHRFASKWQSPLRQRPDPDGINLLDEEANVDRDKWMRHEWVLRKHFLRTLHLPSLIWRHPRAVMIPEGVSHLKGVYGAGRVLHYLELARNPANENDGFDVNEDDEYRDCLMPIFETRKIFAKILEDVASIASAEPPGTALRERFFPKRRLLNDSRPAFAATPARPPLQILTSNIERDNFLDKLLERLEQLVAEAPPISRLLIDMLLKEEAFEMALTVEHIEDRLINKQVVLHDELDLGPEYNKRRIYERHYRSEQGKKQIRDYYETLADIALTNRQRRNFRLFRDWEYQRPWRQIYQQFDSRQAGFEGYKDAITLYDTFTTNLEAHTASKLNLFRSSYGVIIPKLLGFRPRDRSSLPEDQYPKCCVCNKEFVPNAGFKSTVIRQHCGHEAHIHCIFGEWDFPGKQLHKCPLCGNYPALNYSSYGISGIDGYEHITPFVHNLDDYRHAARVAPYRDEEGEYHHHPLEGDLYDVPEYKLNITDPNDPEFPRQAYWRRENELLNAIENSVLKWDFHHFNKGKDISLPPPSRESTIVPGHGRVEVQTDFHATAKSLRKRWMKRNMEAQLRGERDRVKVRIYDVEEAKWLGGARFTREQEARCMRERRRERDLERRRRVKREMRGLHGLRSEEEMLLDELMTGMDVSGQPGRRPSEVYYDPELGIWQKPRSPPGGAGLL